MADILRVTTPLIAKNPPQLNKQPESGEVFSLQELVKVVKSNPQSELLSQNNGLVERSGSSAAFIEMLRDPDVTAGFLRSIFVLQEIVGLLPLNNQTVTPEIRRMFDSLFISQGDIVAEMIRQENSTTTFKGAFFDFLRAALSEGENPEILEATLRLLKAVNSALDGRDALDSVANNLQFLSESLAPSRELSMKLYELSQAFRQPVSGEKLTELKSRILPLFSEIENSILFSPKLAKILPLVIYNLSRYNINTSRIAEAAEKFVRLIENDSQKEEFAKALGSILARVQNAGQEGTESSLDKSAGKPFTDPQYSRVMNTLANIISSRKSDESLSPVSKSRLENVIYSLLSSPSNFTPLLHFVIPVRYENIDSFAEIWINPNGEEDEAPSSGDGSPKCIHLLIVFDISGIGQFEAELFARGRTIDFSLFCPPEHIESFASLERTLRQSIANSGYRFRNVTVGKLERIRSLMEVFASLPLRRMGIDIRV